MSSKFLNPSPLLAFQALNLLGRIPNIQSLYSILSLSPNWPRSYRINPSLWRSDPSPPSLIIQRHLPSILCLFLVGFTERCPLQLSNKRLRSVTSADWRRDCSVTEPTRDGINEATHPPIEDLEIQFEFIRLDQRPKNYTKSIGFHLGFIRDDPSLNTTRHPGH